MPNKKVSEKGSGHVRENVPRKDWRATGPRTTAGKRRSRHNALKDGLFARTTPLPGESAAEYGALINSLLEEYELETASEMENFAYLVGLLWRRRRGMKAEDAAIAHAVISNGLNKKRVLVMEAWDRSRTGETTGGSLRHSSNPLILDEAIAILTYYRDTLEKHGFSVALDNRLLRQLYGVNHDGTAPMGFFVKFQLAWALATGACTGADEKDPEELKKQALKVIHDEIERLKTLALMEQVFTKANARYETMTGLITASDAMEAIMRVQSHTSREIERTMTRLAPARRRRQGGSEPPTLRLELD